MAKDIREKENKKAQKAAKRAARKQQRRQMWEAFKLQRQRDKALIPLMLLGFLVPVVILLLVATFFGKWWINLIVGASLGIAVAVWVFTRRLQKGVYEQIEGEAGAAAWTLNNLRDGVGMKWIVEPGITQTASMDAVHRVVGTPGIVLVGEGNPNRVKRMLARERTKISRIAGNAPIYDVIVGDGEGEVPIKKLQNHLMRLPRNIKKKDVDALNARVDSIARRQSPQANMPKGPLPKGGQMSGMNRRARRAAQRGKK